MKIVFKMPYPVCHEEVPIRCWLFIVLQSRYFLGSKTKIVLLDILMQLGKIAQKSFAKKTNTTNC